MNNQHGVRGGGLIELVICRYEHEPMLAVVMGLTGSGLLTKGCNIIIKKRDEGSQ